MSEPTKVVAFRKPDHPLVLLVSSPEAATFPRFRKEWNRPNPPPPTHPHSPPPLRG